MKIRSTFALLDVLGADRHKLARHFDINSHARIPVVIHGLIAGRWGGDDGTSIEFSVDVTEVTITEGHMAKKATKKTATKVVKKPSKKTGRKAA